MKRVFLPALFLALLGTVSAQNLPKLSAEEIIAKHAASIGTPDALAATKTRVMAGTGVFSSKNQAGKVGGPVQFAAAGDMLLLAMVFNANNYPFEKIGYDGKEFSAAQLPTGTAAPLAGFLKSHKGIVTRGLFSGTLSQGWAPLSPAKELKYTAAGTEKVNGKPMYKVKVGSAGLGDMTISLYFEPETFRHVRSQYFYRIAQLTSSNPGPGIYGEGNPQGTAPSAFTLTEDFSNFAKVESLVLPMNYVIEYTTDAGKPVTWTINFTQVFLNEKLEPGVFKVS